MKIYLLYEIICHRLGHMYIVCTSYIFSNHLSSMSPIPKKCLYKLFNEMSGCHLCGCLVCNLLLQILLLLLLVSFLLNRHQVVEPEQVILAED